MRELNKEGLDSIKRWEGLRTQAYKDAGGVWTIGYGHTASAGEPAPVNGMTITEEEAENIFKRDLLQYEAAVSDTVKVPLTDNQFAALVSFCYNIGIGAFKNSTLVKKLNKGDYDSVPDQLMRWTKANGKQVKGLVNRRSVEVGLWSKGEFVSSNYNKPTKENIFKKPEVMASSGGIISALGGLATGSSPIQWAIAIAIIAFAALALFYFMRR